MLGLVSISFRELSYKELVDVAVKEGIQAIEWGADVHVPPDNLEHAHTVKAYCDAHQIACPTYGSYYHIGVPDHKGNSYQFADILATAKVLGASTVRVWPTKTASADATPEFWEQSASELRTLCQMAEKEGIQLGLEYHWNTLTDSAESTLKFIQLTDMPNIKTYWQMHYERTSSQHMSEIKLLDGHIANIHCYFWEGRTRLPLEEGASVWRKYISALKSQNVPFMLEHIKDDSLEQLSQDVSVLKTLLKKADLY